LLRQGVFQRGDEVINCLHNAVITPFTLQDFHGPRHIALAPARWFSGIGRQRLSSLFLAPRIGVAQYTFNTIADLILLPAESVAIVRGKIQIADPQLGPPGGVEHLAVKELPGCLRRVDWG